MDEATIRAQCEKMRDALRWIDGYLAQSQCVTVFEIGGLRDKIADALNGAEASFSPFADFGAVGVATVHHYEVRETAAGRCNLVATFTDFNRARDYAASLAGEGEEE